MENNKYDGVVMTQDKNGNWIPAVPEPYHYYWYERVFIYLGLMKRKW